MQQGSAGCLPALPFSPSQGRLRAHSGLQGTGPASKFGKPSREETKRKEKPCPALTAHSGGCAAAFLYSLLMAPTQCSIFSLLINQHCHTSSAGGKRIAHPHTPTAPGSVAYCPPWSGCRARCCGRRHQPGCMPTPAHCSS